MTTVSGENVARRTVTATEKAAMEKDLIVTRIAGSAECE